MSGASSSHEKSDSPLKRLPLFAVILGLLIGIGLALKTCDSVSGSTSASSSVTPGVSSLPSVRSQQGSGVLVQTGTPCPAFGESSTTCDAGMGETQWISPAIGLPPGLTYCFSPTIDAVDESGKNVYESVKYLDSTGRAQTLKPGERPKGIRAYKFVLARPTTLSYNMSSTGCPGDEVATSEATEASDTE